MYPLGLLPVFSTLIPDSLAVAAALAIPALVLALSLYALLPRSLPLPLPPFSARPPCSHPPRSPASSPPASEDEDEDEEHDDSAAPVHLPGSSLAHILPFFHRRFDFINSGFQLAGQAVYQFSLLRTPVIVLSGEAARRDFFQAKDLDLNAGFKFLSGAIPMVPGVTSNLETRRIALIHKRLVASQTSERLASLIPQILEDSRRVISTWGYSGAIDPFQHLSELLFQTTVRCLAFQELADDPRAVARLKHLYDTLDAATTPATVLLPWWVPVPSAVRRLLATKRIYDVVGSTLDARVRGGPEAARDDTPQMLIDAGDERLVIVGFIMGLLVAGARSTGTTASWLVTFLSGHPEWREKAAEEVRRLIAAHATHLPPSCTGSSPEPTPVPLSAWEAHTPVLDAIIRETLRVAEPHEKEKKAKARTLFLGGKAVPPGAFVMYPFSDVHLSAEIYRDPWRWDPGRPELDLKAPYAYVGMGAGATVCLGKRLATLELKLVTALFALGFGELRAVDRRGAPLRELPRPNWNDVLTCRPPKGACFVRFERTAEPGLCDS
ncbi:cytochrome P450 [Daedaleopsis nitida]|nr:cytochrome P450 [Daedaleopsis nitida]